MDIKLLLEKQRTYFASGATLVLEFRIEQLKKWKSIIQTNESAIALALSKDLHKSDTESFLTEIQMALDEIDFIIKNLKSWARPQKTRSPFPMCWPGRSKTYFEPYGSALIIGPWNYPFLLVLLPLVGAISAGNCAIVKPSEIAENTQNLIYELVNDHFPSEFIAAVKAGPDEMQSMLQQQFDYIFFTGGTHVGKLIMTAAAQHLTPVTLELGGKSPCIVDDTANFDYAARRIMWGKFINAGQTCIAPDYLLVHHTQKDKLVSKLIAVLEKFYGNDPATSSSYCHIINKKHFNRLTQLLQKGKVITGGKIDEDNLYIAPTLIDNIGWDDPIMREEIFGPILPILTYDNLDEAVSRIRSLPKPLALYLFTGDKQIEKKIIKEISFGNGCVNDCVLQIANNYLPFGGVGSSGMGNYHGRYSFETFSHRKSVFKRVPMVDTRLEYPPYSDNKLKWLRRLLKL